MTTQSSTQNPWRPNVWNGLAYGVWLSLAVWVGITSDSWKGALSILGLGIGTSLFWGILVAAIGGMFLTKKRGWRLVSSLVIATYVLGGLLFAYGVWERWHFMETGETPAMFVTHDYGDTFPAGEVERLRATACKDYGPLEIVQRPHGWTLRCGRFFWNSHTYVTTVDPIGVQQIATHKDGQ